MLSVENLPGPSCPCKASALKSDERASDQLAFQEADPVGLGETQPPNFSIRDYVFTSRSKDIATNWPFPQQFLQFCLDHGIRDILPPFEPPDLVRSQLCGKGVGFEQPVASPETEPTPTQIDLFKTGDVDSFNKEPDSIKYDVSLASHTLALNCSDQARYQSKVKGKPTVDEVDNEEVINAENEIHSTVTSNDQSEKILGNFGELPSPVHLSRSVSEASSELEFPEPPPQQDKLEISQQPIEKKCSLIVKLSAISEANRAEDVSSVSSTVSDLMASKVCPVCKVFSSTSNTTLNAHIDQCLSLESNAMRDVINVPKLKAKPRNKRLMVDIYKTAAHFTLEDLDRRNGTNWASEMSILSTNCTSESMLVAQSNKVDTEAKKPKLSPEDVGDDENEGAVYVDSHGIKLRILSTFDKAPQVVSRKDLKLRMQAKDMKASKSSLISKHKHIRPNHTKHMKVKLQKKKSNLLKPSKGQIQGMAEGDYHADKHREKRESEGQIVNALDQVKKSECATIRQWVCSKRSDLPKKLNIHKSSNISVTSTKNPLTESKQVDPVHRPFVKSHVLKFSSSSEIMTSSPKTKRMDILCNSRQNMVKENNSPKPSVFNTRWKSEGSSANGLLLKLSRSTGRFVSFPRSKREEIGRPSFSLEAKRGDGNEKHRVTKKSRKHRPLSGGKSNETTRIHQSDILVSVVRSREEEILDQSSLRSSKIQESNKERRGLQVDPMVCADVGTEHSMEQAVHETINVETTILEKFKQASIAELKQCPSLEEHLQPVCETDTETQLEPVAQRLLGEQSMQYGDVTHNQIITQSIQIAGEVELTEDSPTTRDTKCHADSCVQGSTACLTSHGDMDYEIPQENSSVTSTGVLSSQNHKSSERETSGSLVSTSSISFPSSPKDSELKDSKEEPSERATAVRDNPSSILSKNLELPPMPSSKGTTETNIKKRNKAAMAAPLLKQSQQFVNDQPCCCSRRESISRDPQPPRPGIVAVMPFRTSISSSFNSCPSMSTDMLAIPTVELPSSYPFTEASSKPAVKVPSIMDFSSPSSSPRTQTLLRLMGKNLMVSQEQSVQLPVPASHGPLKDTCYSPLGFASTGTISNQESLLYHQHHQLPSCSAVFGQVQSMPNHQMPVGDFSGHLTHPKILSKKLNKPSAFNVGVAASHQQVQNPTSSQSPYVTREVIMIDDSPEHEAEVRGNLVNPSTSIAPIASFPASDAAHQRPFSCFPPRNQYLTGEVLNGSVPSFSISCPRTIAKPMMGGSTSEGSTALLPRPLLFSTPSTGHLAPPLYYPQALQ